MRAFKRAGEVYKSKHNKPPVIIYNNISQLVHKNLEILDILQDDAKDNADDRKYITVFVSSEGSVPRRMESCSAWSRAKQPVMEIGDLSKEESIEYLTKKRKINEVEAKNLYELVVEKKFQSAQLLKKQSHHEVGKEIIRALLESKELSFVTFMKFFNNYKEASKVLETNVFAYHPEKNTVTFLSQSVKYYIQKNTNVFIK
ncbi:9455_t:CDS:2 [Ambispora leptoticha]|uniref:9455_t:CDS:1 n=1 Tax=Ambispora leptoticha TaxID=144679 RepID=A0A9N9F872_9GLOM|nr:9455_t:CDS:2 [Ambispora leptoticha]